MEQKKKKEEMFGGMIMLHFPFNESKDVHCQVEAVRAQLQIENTPAN